MPETTNDTFDGDKEQKGYFSEMFDAYDEEKTVEAISYNFHKNIDEVLEQEDFHSPVLDITEKTSKSLDEVLCDNETIKKDMLYKYYPTISDKMKHTYKDTYFDKMTGCLNRNGGYPILKEMIEKKDRVSLVSFDLDHFKAINEVLGKEFGDRLIEDLGHRLRNLSIETDQEFHPVRMGGEEFVVINDMPQEELSKIMGNFITDFKKHILSVISRKQQETGDNYTALLKANIFKNKYFRDEKHGMERAENEIGGTTVGIIDFFTNEIKDDPNAWHNALQLVDSIMEVQKNNNGRGRVYGKELVAKDGDKIEMTPEHTQKRIKEFVPRTELFKEQSDRINKEFERLNGLVNNQFLELTPKFNQIHDKYEGNRIAQKTLLQVVQSPSFSRENMQYLLKILEISEEEEIKEFYKEIIELQKEYINAKQRIFSYTGASNYEFLKKETSNENNKFYGENLYKISIPYFKAINEIAGHTGGDCFLTYIFQEVILEAKRMSKIKDEEIIIAQKGCDFQFVLHEKVKYKKDDFEKKLKILFKEKYQKFDKEVVEESRPKNSQAEDKNNRRTDNKVKTSGKLSQKCLEWIKFNKDASDEISFDTLSQLIIEK